MARNSRHYRSNTTSKHRGQGKLLRSHGYRATGRARLAEVEVSEGSSSPAFLAMLDKVESAIVDNCTAAETAPDADAEKKAAALARRRERDRARRESARAAA